MDKNNTGGAKPKTSTGSNSNHSSSSSSSSSRPSRTSTSSNSQPTSNSQTRNRSPRRESTYTTRSRGGGVTGFRSNAGSRHTPSQADSDAPRRASIPNSVARGRLASSNQSQNNSTSQPSVNERSPTRVAETRTRPRQNGRSTYSRPVLRQRNGALRNVEPLSLSPDSPSDDLSLVPPGVTSGVDDLRPDSPVSPSESSAPQEAAASLGQLAALRPRTGRPMSSSRDAVLARELLQAEADMMLQRDEEMARQLQAELDDSEPSPLAYPLSMFVPGGLQARGRHYPSVPGRMEGRGPRATDHRSPRALRLFRGPDGAVRVGLELPGRGGGLRVLMRAGAVGRGARGRRAPEPEPGNGSSAEPGSSSSADDGGSLPAGELDPEERLLGEGSDNPDDFLSVMHDPSLMLLMLLLRAPDTLYQNEGGVDLDDYEGLWELAERLGEVHRRGITEDQINRLPTRKFRDGNREASSASGKAQCQICLVDFENGDCLRSIPCQHDFHKDCIDQWLKRNATCPICRQVIKPSGT